MSYDEENHDSAADARTEKIKEVICMITHHSDRIHDSLEEIKAQLEGLE